MSEKVEYIKRFPRGFPSAYSGVLLHEKRALITGHINGIVVKWNIGTGEYGEIFRSDSTVQTISNFEDTKIAIGYHSGGLYVYYLDTNRVITIQEPTYHKNKRVWKTKWIDENNLIMTSTFGEVRLIRFKSEDSWDEFQLRGHTHAIFALSKYDSRVLTGDWNGNIFVWEIVDDSYQVSEKTRISGTIQGLHWHSEKCIVAINKSGKLYLIERAEDDTWQISTEIDIAQNRGNCVILTYDGDIIYAGTNSEIIQFDISTNQMRIMNLRNVKELFIDNENIYALTHNALIKFDKERTEIPENIINYRFKKVSLLGHTGTGKSTFCNLMVTGKVEEIYSTYGKRVWNLQLPKDDGYDKRIVLHDHGGQVTVLDTFLPFLNDSDIFLLFYSQIDKTTFERAYHLLSELRNKVGDSVDIYLIQTFIDHNVDEVPYAVIDELVDKGIITDMIKISPYKNIGIEDIYKVVIDKIDWEKSKIMISSPFIEGINDTINILRLNRVQTTTFEEFKKLYQYTIKDNIANRHLVYLLNDATNEGKIEYYPEILDVIILNDEEFNKMRTEIPILVDHNNGIINMTDLDNKYENKAYLKILDEYYIKTNISFKYENYRIFPKQLKDDGSDIPKYYRDNLSKVEKTVIQVKYKDINISQLLEQFSEMRLQYVDISLKDGLFTWSDNAYIYYNIHEEGDEITGKNLCFTYYISGKIEDTTERLKLRFENIIEKLYGPIIDIKTSEEIDDKKKLDRTYEFDVALSFADEQRLYVETVADILKSEGIEVFYDVFHQSQMWGKNLIEYFKEVYYSKSKYCIMFISREYLIKMWPSHERRSATARDLEEFGEYILPVVFERGLDVPGLDKYRGYLGVWKYPAVDVARIFLEKLSEE